MSFLHDSGTKATRHSPDRVSLRRAICIFQNIINRSFCYKDNFIVKGQCNKKKILTFPSVSHKDSLKNKIDFGGENKITFGKTLDFVCPKCNFDYLSSFMNSSNCSRVGRSSVSVNS